MKIKHSIQIDGVDYTDKLISISDIDIGVRDLGFGYISDITAELVFDGNLLNTIGKTAVIGLLVDGKSYIYKGIIRKVDVKNNKATLQISHILSVKSFKKLNTYYSPSLNENVIVPVIYGNDIYDLIKLDTVAVGYETNTYGAKSYYFLYGDKPVNLFNATEIQTNVWAIKTKIWDESKYGSKTHPWFELIESNVASLYRRYKFNINYNIDEKMMTIYALTGNMTFYGGKKQDDGSITYTEITIDPVDLVGYINDIYDELKIVHADSASFSSGIWNTTLWTNKQLDKTFSPKKHFNSRMDSTKITPIDKAIDIIEDILKTNGFTVSKKLYSVDVRLNFQSSKDYKTIIQKVAEMGLLYIIPNMNNSFDIITAVRGGLVIGPSTPSLNENDFIENSFKISIKENDFNKLKLVLNKGENISYYGTGTREKEYQADYIADQTSADNFGYEYLNYYSSNLYVSFETPIYSKYLDLDVGDFVNVSYLKYQIDRIFQIIQKTIQSEKIRFVCKELPPLAP